MSKGKRRADPVAQPESSTKRKKTFGLQSRSYVDPHQQTALSAWARRSSVQSEENFIFNVAECGSPNDDCFGVSSGPGAINVDENNIPPYCDDDSIIQDVIDDDGCPSDIDETGDHLEPPVDTTDDTDAADSKRKLASMYNTLVRCFGNLWPEVEAFLKTEQEAIDVAAVRNKFEEFRERESSFSGGSPALIVKPSGDPTNALHLKLNYPTFRTQKLEYGESADITNPSTKLLMQKGLLADQTFWFEADFRRRQAVKGRSKSRMQQSTQVLSIHTETSSWLERLSKKVFLIFGAENRKDFNARYNSHQHVIQLTESERVTTGLIRQGGSISYIIVYCPHPEWILWNWTIWAGRYYDACINVAAVLSKVEVNPSFFESRAKALRVVATSAIAERDIATTRKLETTNSFRCPPGALPETVKIFCSSNDISDNALEKRKSKPTQPSWNQGVRMPRNLPRNVPAATLIVAPTPSRPVQLIPNDTRSKNKIVKTAMIHLGRSIPLMCIRCGKTPERKPVDNRPAFCTISAATGKYIAQRQACRTPACNPKERKGQVDQFMVPQDPTIPYIRSDNLLKVEVPENS